MSAPDILYAVYPVIRALETLGVTYFIGGSVASSAYGKARSTLDVDVVADLRQEHVTSLVRALSDEYYIDEGMIRDAIARRSSTNVVHLATMVKVDIFVLKARSYDQEVVRRKRVDTLDEEHGAARIFLASPEDVVLNKLEWFRLGAGLSERQWGDVVGVIRVQGPLLDRAYVRSWAAELGVSDLLEEAFRDADLPP